MSCPGDNYVVPGANPCDPSNNQGGGNVESIIAGANVVIDPVNGLGNVTINANDAPVTSLVAGTGITLSPSNGLGNVTINALQTQAFGNNSITTAAVTAAAVPLSTVGFTNGAVSDILCNGTATFSTTSNTRYNINVYLTIDGVKMNTTDFVISIDGIGHYATATITGFRSALAASAHTLRMWASTNAPNGTITCISQTTNGLANLI